MFKLFADLIALQLDSQERLRLSELALFDERQTSLLREQFIAVLGHDLRNPLNAISGGAQALLLMDPDERAKPVITMVRRSAVRMAVLIDSLMDFARGRLRRGISVDRWVDPNFPARLEQVIDESRTTWPDREIHKDVTLDRPIACDGGRIGQLLSNLLANVYTHGDAGGPIPFASVPVTRPSRSQSPTPAYPSARDHEQLFQPFSGGRATGTAGIRPGTLYRV